MRVLVRLLSNRRFDLSLSTNHNKMRIFVQPCDPRKRYCLEVEPSDTVKALKLRLIERGMRRSTEILYRGSLLQDNHTLEDYNFEVDETLELRPVESGGGPGFGVMNIGFTFSALNKEVIKPLRRVDGDETHLIVRPGLIFKSKCLNPNCRVYNEVVYINKGYSEGPNATFNVAKLITNLNCPICQVKAERATSCGFMLSQWTFTGQTQGGCEVNKSGKTNTENYHTWEEGDNEAYCYLEVHVEPYYPI